MNLGLLGERYLCAVPPFYFCSFFGLVRNFIFHSTWKCKTVQSITS